MDVNKVSGVPTIHNTNILQELDKGNLVEGSFVITGDGEIKVIDPVTKILIKWFHFSDGRQPVKLGLLLQRLEASSQPNDNADYLIDRDFARMPSNTDVTMKVKKAFEDLHSKGDLQR